MKVLRDLFGRNMRYTGDRHTLRSLTENALPEIRERLLAIQTVVERVVPGAAQCISYRMPSYRLGPIFFHFAAFKNHIGIYPPVSGPEELLAELAPYSGPRGNLKFPHSDPLPLAAIGRVATALAKETG